MNTKEEKDSWYRGRKDNSGIVRINIKEQGKYKYT